jgi:hypothetical protein
VAAYGRVGVFAKRGLVLGRERQGKPIRAKSAGRKIEYEDEFEDGY